MKLRDEAAWQEWVDNNPLPDGFSDDPRTWPEDLTHEQSGDAYGACVVIAARLWMNEMEARIEDGRTIEGMADESFSKVNDSFDRWGLTGFQYGASASIVAKCWKHGEEFRRWFNLHEQIGDEGERANEEGGVLNPAMLKLNM